MNAKEIMNAYIIGHSPKDFKKLKITKSKAYKIYSRFLYIKEMHEKLIWMALNLSEREFQAVRNKELKTEQTSQHQKKSFVGGGMKLPKNIDVTQEIDD